MASLGIRCGVNPMLIQNARSSLRTDRFSPNPSSILNQISTNPPQRVSSSAAISNYPMSAPYRSNFEPHCHGVEDRVHNEPMFSQKLDEWMRDSVVEIVKNLKQAPLLVQIYANHNDGLTKVETEKAIAENWANVNREWTEGDRPSPDGIILVEELEEEEEMTEEETRAWGVVIQGKVGEKERVPACYLLKTSRVGSGLGLFCTHFCLVRVKSFRETAASQFKDCWLLH
ncbi:hypothetical protein LguiA_023862 [Lonicera macranthoides]